MAKQKVLLYGTINPRVIFIDDAATIGATVGVDLKLADGTVVTADAILNSAIPQSPSVAASDWTKITSKPATFPPSAHTHAPAEITGFGSAGGYLRSDGTAWVRVAGVAWADLTGVPATFAPSAHTHTSADITGLSGLPNAVDDAAAAAAGVPVGGMYRNGSALMVRIA